MALAAVTAWSRIEEPLTALAVLALGALLAFGYMEAHERLTRRLREVTGRDEDA
jgi:hypothetical protein